MALLEVKNLNTYFFTQSGVREAVKDVSFSVRAGETFGLVGESGSGKSVTALSILRLIYEPGRIVSGSILFDPFDKLRVNPEPLDFARDGSRDGEHVEPQAQDFKPGRVEGVDGMPLLALSAEEMRGVRGKDIAMVFQEPLAALNPVMTIGEQITEQILAHKKVSKKEAKARAIELMDEVRLSRPGDIFHEYPHRLSGGMRQRAMIAMALSLRPKLLIADEPTTALDVTIQAEILDLFREIKEKHNMSILFITHDFGIVAQLADRVGVMKNGAIVEEGSVDNIFYSPKDPYTKELLEAVPKIQFAGCDASRWR